MRSAIVAIMLSVLLLQTLVAAEGPSKAIQQDIGNSSEVASQSPNGDDDGLIVFFRPQRFTGSALKPSVYIDGQQIARLENGRYFFSLRLSPGKHQITSSMKQSALDLD